MELPGFLNIPFFSYGLFKPGQIGFIHISRFVDDVIYNQSVSGRLYELNEIAVISLDFTNMVQGVLIYFKPDLAKAAYEFISKIEPQEFFKWETVDISNEQSKEKIKANILHAGKKSEFMTPININEWDGISSPSFREALEVVKDIIDHNENFNLDYRSLYKIQMAYFLLWESMKKYAVMKYFFKREVGERIWEIPKEEEFAKQLKFIVHEKREMFHLYDKQLKIVLNPENPKNAFEYYNQVRHLSVHRNNIAYNDFNVLRNSLSELYNIFVNIKYKDMKLSKFSRKISKDAESIEKIASILKESFNHLDEKELQKLDIKPEVIDWKNLAKNLF